MVVVVVVVVMVFFSHWCDMYIFSSWKRVLIISGCVVLCPLVTLVLSCMQRQIFLNLLFLIARCPMKELLT
jgi:hypothetical protein